MNILRGKEGCIPFILNINPCGNIICLLKGTNIGARSCKISSVKIAEEKRKKGRKMSGWSWIFSTSYLAQKRNHQSKQVVSAAWCVSYRWVVWWLNRWFVHGCFVRCEVPLLRLGFYCCVRSQKYHPPIPSRSLLLLLPPPPLPLLPSPSPSRLIDI